MKYFILIVIFLLCVPIVGIYAEDTDIVVLLDTSKSVFPYFDSLVDYLINTALKKHVEKGDMFHLLTFAGSVEKEMLASIDKKEDDLERILRDILLIHPLGDYTDLVGALKFLQEYTLSLEEEHSKVVIILTDGIHDPPPGSEYDDYTREEVERFVKDTSKTIREASEEVDLIQLPGVQKTSAETEQQEEGVVSGKVTAEDQEETPSAKTAAEDKEAEDISSREGISEQDETKEDETKEDAAYEGYIEQLSEELEEPIQKFEEAETRPDGEDKTGTGEPSGEAVTGEADGKHGEPPDAEKQSDARTSRKQEDRTEGGDRKKEPPERRISARRGRAFSVPLPLLFGIIAAAIAAGLFIFLIVRKAIEEGTFSTIRKRIKIFSLNETAIELHVFGQNTNIGLRNVHVIRKGKSRCVGGKNSDFLIFLVPLPRCIGSIAKKNGSYEFRVKKEEFFPDTDRVIPDCLNKRLRLISSNGREVYFVFRVYISKLERINNIMRLIEKPGPIKVSPEIQEP